MFVTRRKYLLLFCFAVSHFFFTGRSFSQQLRYDFKNLTPSDGLPSSEVYQVLQDSQHYMWFATDHGVCRYNGYSFETFNLPDNSILGLYEDVKKRVWACSFSGQLYYFQHGKFEGYKWNERLLNDVRPGIINGIYVDSTDIVHISASGPSYLKISANGDVEHSTRLAATAQCKAFQISRSDFFTAIGAYPLNFAKGYKNITPSTVLNFVLKDGNKTVTIPHVVQPEKCRVKMFPDQEIVFFSKDCMVRIPRSGSPVFQRNEYTIEDIEEVEGKYYLATEKGLLIQDKKGNILDEYFKDIHITSVEKDAEGGLWLSSLTKGVFYLKYSRIRHLAYTGAIADQRVKVLLLLHDSSVLAGTQGSELIRFKSDSMFDRFDVNVKDIVSLYQFNPSLILLGSSVKVFDSVATITNRIIKRNELGYLRLPNNSNFIVKDHILYSGTTGSMLEFDISNLNRTLAHSKESFRVSKLFLEANKDILVGNLYGLWRYQEGRLHLYDSTKPVLQSRITDIAEYKQESLCLGTRGKGLLILRAGSISQLTTTSGLISNNIRKIFIDDDHIWLATNSGISVVTIQSVSPLRYTVKNISVQDGLLSNEVNDILNYGRQVIIASNSGISFVAKNAVLNTSRYSLPFYVTDIKVNGLTADAQRLQLLGYKNRNVAVSFEALNYSNPGKNNYRYRLLGYDTAWLYTNDLRITFNPMPYGSYELQIQAKREFDTWSQASAAILPVQCKLPFWSTVWFFVLSLALVVLLSYLYFRSRVQLFQKRQNEKNELRRKIAETEQMALRSQMNPHFIFNSLNSIQQYVIERDVKGANAFISGFSKLIRQTLEFSAKEKITLAEEISYLSNYLELEKLRTDNRFRFDVEIKTIHSLSELEIPPLLLQPYVENALRHGVRFLQNKEGIIRLLFKEEAGILTCSVEDNGLGREKAQLLKSKNIIEYQSKGMSLTENRIELLNKSLERKIKISIEDLKDEVNEARGTRVVVFFPV